MEGRYVYENCSYSSEYRLTRTVLNSAIALPCIFGNLLILMSIIKYKLFKSSVYFLISSLAMADLLHGFTLLTYFIEGVAPALKTERNFCLLRQASLYALLAISGVTFSIISLTRVVAVMCPINYRAYKRCVNIAVTAFIIAGWIGAFVIGYTSIFLINRYTVMASYAECEATEILPLRFVLTSGILGITGMIVNITNYSVIICKLRRKSAIKGQQYRMTKQMTLICVLFCLCWAPFAVLALVSYWVRSIYCYIEYTTQLAFANSAINWIIYGIVNKTLRKAFLTLCCRCYGTNKHTTQGHELTTS